MGDSLVSGEWAQDENLLFPFDLWLLLLQLCHVLLLPFPSGAWPSVWLPFVLSFLLGSHFVQQDTGEYLPKLTNLFGIHTSVDHTARRQALPLMRSGISHPAYPHPTIGMQR